MNRRGFLAAMLAACAAPAIVRADSLMRIVPMDSLILHAEFPSAAVIGNRLLDIRMITREALAILEKELPFISEVNRRYDSAFADDGGGIVIPKEAIMRVRFG